MTKVGPTAAGLDRIAVLPAGTLVKDQEKVKGSPSTSLEPGQRGPNFALRNAEGRVERFYDRFIGNMMLLLFYPSRQSPAATAALQGLAAQADALKAAGTAAVAVSREDLGSIRTTKADLALPYPL